MRNSLRILSALMALALCLSLVPAVCAEVSITVPEAAQSFFADRIAKGYTITAWEDDPLHNHAYAVLSKDGENRLFVLQNKGDSYAIELSTNKAVYQGEVSMQIASWSDTSFVVVYFLSATASESYYYVREYDGIWRLYQYNLSLEDGSRRVFQTFYDDRMVYMYYPPATDDPSKTRNIYGVYQRALRYLNLNTLPHTLQEARATLSLPPEIPDGDFYAYTVSFRAGEKYEVYTAPGDTSLRAANGKAMVSTNDWIQVFGTENGWALIQYEVSATVNRIGYITLTALPSSASVPELGFVPQPIEILRDATVTDDPIEQNAQIATLQKEQADCYYLATFSSSLVYIQGTTATGQTFRGFVDKDAIRFIVPETGK